MGQRHSLYATSTADQPVWWIGQEPHIEGFSPPIEPNGRSHALVRVECQGCSREFDVVLVTTCDLGPNLTNLASGGRIPEATVPPPPHKGCRECTCIGVDAASIVKVTLQVWTSVGAKPRRRPDLEGEIAG